MKHSHFFGKLFFVFVLNLNELSEAVLTSHVIEPTKFIEDVIGLAELSDVDSGSELMKRTSIVEGGVFVPYKSTTIVYKSRLVPVTYGFVINKETLDDNPGLNKLGVKMLDKSESSGKKHLKSKSNGDKGSKVLLKLLNNLSEDVAKIKQKLFPEVESLESGHQGLFKKTWDRRKTTKNHFSKKWLKYLRCIKGKKKCSLFLKRHQKRTGRRITLRLRNKRKRLRTGMSSSKRGEGAKSHRNS